MKAPEIRYPRPRRASEPYRPIARATSRRGLATITILEAHTVRRSQWIVSLTGPTGEHLSQAFAALVGPGGAREWANEQWAAL